MGRTRFYNIPVNGRGVHATVEEKNTLPVWSSSIFGLCMKLQYTVIAQMKPLVFFKWF